MGFVIESSALAQRMVDAFASGMPQRAYEVQLGDALQWLERQGDRVMVHATEPHSGAGLRLGAWLLSLLPIEWIL